MICSKCNRDVPEEFIVKGRKHCKACRVVSVSASRRKNAAMVREYKEKHSCMDCGVKYPYYVMQFDHNKGKKEFGMAHVTRTNVSKIRIQNEIEKCDIVCANCHAERSYKRQFGESEAGLHPAC